MNNSERSSGDESISGTEQSGFGIRPESDEPVEKRERTRESEIQDNIQIWRELGVDVDEDDVRAKIEALPEKEGFDWYLYVPEGIDDYELQRKVTSLLKSKAREDGMYSDTRRADLNLDQFIGKPLSDFRASAATTKSYAVATQYRREADPDSLSEAGRRSALEWEITGESFMSPVEYFLAELRWSKENDSFLDEDHGTMCPGYRRIIVKWIKQNEQGQEVDFRARGAIPVVKELLKEILTQGKDRVYSSGEKVPSFSCERQYGRMDLLAFGYASCDRAGRDGIRRVVRAEG